MLSHIHLNTRYNYNYIKRQLTTNFPNYVRATYSIWVPLRTDRWQQISQITLWRHIQCALHYERSLTTDFPNYVRATYTKLVALCAICCPSFTFMRHAIESNQEMIVDNLFSKLHQGDIYNLGYTKKRSLTTDFPNYVRATYTKLVA